MKKKNGDSHLISFACSTKKRKKFTCSYLPLGQLPPLLQPSL